MTFPAIRQIALRTELFAITAGLFLYAMLPLALTNIHSLAYLLFFFFHVTLQGLAALTSCLRLLQLSQQTGRWGKVFLLVFLLFLIAAAVPGLLPITARDSLLYHLAVPKMWLEAGKMRMVPWHEWSFFPLMVSLGYAALLRLDLTNLSPFYNLSFLLIATGVCARLTFNLTKNPKTALLAALLLFSLPLNFRLAVEPMADHAVLLYFALAFWGATSVDSGNLTKSAAVFTGVSLGLAVSSKYSAFLGAAVFLPFLALYWSHISRRFHRALSLTFVAMLITGCLAAPWLIRNYIWIGNPVHPFLQSFFNDKSSNLAFLGAINPLQYRLEIYHESLWEVVFLPLRLFFEGKDGNPAHFDGVLSPLLLLALLPAFMPRREAWISFFTHFWTSYLGFSLLMFYALVRYQLPGIFALVVLSACACLKLMESVRWQRIAKLLLAAHLIFCAIYVTQHYRRIGLLKYLLAPKDREAFLSSRLDDYDMVRYINQAVPKDAGVYLVFTGNRFFLFEVRVRSQYFSADPILEALNHATSEEDVYEQLTQLNCRYFAFHTKRTKHVLASLPKHQQLLWQNFSQRHLTPRATIGNYSLLHLEPPSIRRPTTKTDARETAAPENQDQS